MQNLSENYNNALNLLDKEFSHQELISFLENGSVIERQFASLNLKKVQNKEEAHLLLNNLVGVDGKIREATALKVNELTSETPELFFDERNFELFLNATIDIDSNVCRLAILSALNLKQFKEFSNFYTNGVIEVINSALDEISKFTFRDKKYKINKQIFKIYWCLEALIYFSDFADKKLLENILTKCSELPEYTVREKCAKILCKTNFDNLNDLKNRLKADENYYVRNIFVNH